MRTGAFEVGERVRANGYILYADVDGPCEVEEGTLGTARGMAFAGYMVRVVWDPLPEHVEGLLTSADMVDVLVEVRADVPGP